MIYLKYSIFRDTLKDKNKKTLEKENI